MPNALIETSSLVPEIAMGHVIAHQNNAFRVGWLSSHRRFDGIALHGIEDAQHPYSLNEYSLSSLSRELTLPEV